MSRFKKGYFCKCENSWWCIYVTFKGFICKVFEVSRCIPISCCIKIFNYFFNIIVIIYNLSYNSIRDFIIKNI